MTEDNSGCTLRTEHNKTPHCGHSSKLLSFPRIPINISPIRGFSSFGGPPSRENSIICCLFLVLPI